MTYWIENIEQTESICIKLLHYDNANTNDKLDTSILTKNELTKFNSYKSTKRKLEFYYTRVLWSAFHHPDTIIYRPTGKPTLEKGFLSISHSHQSIAIAYSAEHELGVDIEPISKKIKRVRHKFLHSAEQFETLKELTEAWCVKEAVYKLMDMDDVFFMDNIYLSSTKSDMKAKIMIDDIDILPTYKLKALDNDLIMAWAFIEKEI